MAITLADLIKNPDLIKELSGPHEKCIVCSCDLQKFITGKISYQQGYACEDCYWDEMSNGIEESPPGNAGIRRS